MRPHRLTRPLRGVLLALFLLLVLSGAGEVLAQTGAATATDAFAEGFEPVPGGKPATEEVDASLLVIFAYGAFAIAFVGYLFHLARTQNRIARDIQELGQRLDSARRD